MFYLLIAILFSSMLSILMRLSESKIKGNVAMLAVNYVTCTIVAFIDAGAGNVFTNQSGIGIALVLGLIGGCTYLSSFLLLQYNISKNGVVLPATFMKLGLLVPTVVSVVIFHERPEILQIVGFALAIIAIVLINSDKKSGGSSDLKVGLLVALLIFAGLGDAMSKIHEEIGNVALADTFLLFTFGTACVLCIIVMFYKKQTPEKWELIFGVLMGVPNYLSSKFLLSALNYLAAVIVFPTFSVGCIVVITLAGLLLFKEKLTKRQAVALCMITVALALLNM